jgi:hypothetical protein
LYHVAAFPDESYRPGEAGPMKRSTIIAATVAASSVLATSCSFFESKFELACEDVVKSRLLAPSAYKRISIERDDQLLTREEYVAYLADRNESDVMTKLYLKGFDDGQDKPSKLRAFITYDAPNAFGTPIRGTSECEYVSNSGKEDSDRNFYRLLVKVDGDDQNSWLVKRLKEAKQ